MTRRRRGRGWASSSRPWGRRSRCWARSGRSCSGNAEDELAAGVAALDALVRVGGALEREGLLDVRLEAAVVDELGELVQVEAGRPHEHVVGLGHVARLW